MKNTEKYLKLLSNAFPTARKAASEIINLSANLNLPKGTEHFISDIHGEYEAFNHILKNGSGSIAKKVDDEFGGELTVKQKKTLCTLIYYPEEKLELIEKTEKDFESWCKRTLLNLIRITRRMVSKYNRAKVKAAVKSEYEYIIEELLTERAEVPDKEAYYDEILQAIIDTESAKAFIAEFCRLIQTLAIERLHVIGDIFDRGNGAEQVIERLIGYHSVDIEWGNHDVEWMGAACGSYACIASVLRVAIKNGNLNTIENGYGINLVPIISFALNTYSDDTCALFATEWGNEDEKHIFTKVHKAVTVILFKLEGQLSEKHPEFGMDNRRILENIDTESGTVKIDGNVYKLLDKDFPTILKNAPYRLTEEEECVMRQLKISFTKSERLQRHVEFLYNRGSMYRIYNGNLLYHGCVPFTGNGEFLTVTVGGEQVKGKALFDSLEKWARKARYSKIEEEREYGKDVLYYMWACSSSPLFGKEKMATFERYYLTDENVKIEHKNSYYTFYNDKEKVKTIFDEFGLNFATGHIINGHVPVKVRKGQHPVHCNGKVIIIDGGFSESYRAVTGIAGYTLVFNSHGLKLVAHEPFVSVKEAVLNESDIHSVTEVVDANDNRLRIADTDKGKEMLEQITDLKELIHCYKSGILKEHQS
ncbi:MAG: fructose-1,6-bisphosphatase [Roseburia sp.]|nr:fructose-1,6-bisphosphatase [Roseburia sp.]